MASSLHVLEQRLRVLEARVAEIEGGFGETLYQVSRTQVRHGILLERIAQRLDVALPSDDEVDQALDDR